MPDSLQRALGFAGAIVTLPLLVALGAALKLETRGPALYRAVRVGEAGRAFTCFKLRTMHDGAAIPGTTGVTVAADSRVTRVGRLLRRFRLDELPQLWNVARGDMRLVGPRPEDPRYVDLSDPLHREVFASRPGITGLTQLVYADEAAMLDSPDPERQYREAVLPAKLRIDAAYLRSRSTALDVWILVHTPLALLGRRVQLPAPIRLELDAIAR
ncbi:MAG TPA: sugar transferase [Candidatus Limnocylindrales bacterium]|nr:sugar transferase [Candidatus Limnocylindrales bacterium]